MNFSLAEFKAGKPAYDFLGNEWVVVPEQSASANPVTAICDKQNTTAIVYSNGVIEGRFMFATLTFDPNCHLNDGPQT